MLDRVKFVLGYWRAYRRARREGAAHEDAKIAAAHDVLAARLGLNSEDAPEALTLPESISTLWRTPDALVSDAKGGVDAFGNGPFTITTAHLALLARMRFAWDGAERGAPMLDPERPYGRRDLLAQIGETFGEADTDVCALRHVEMRLVLARALKHAVLKPGRYALRNMAPADVREALQGYGGAASLSDRDIGLDGDGEITVTEEHLKLMRHIEIRWPSEWDAVERIENGTYPAAAADAKRPYGDYTFIEVDMARILGCLPPPPEAGAPAAFTPEPALAAHLQRLHWQILGTMQAFVENVELSAGVYDLDPE